MERFRLGWFGIILLVIALFALVGAGCGDDDDDDDSSAPFIFGDDDDDDDATPADDDDDDDTSVDDDDDTPVDDDDDDSDDDDDDFVPPPVVNPNAKADGFRLFYKERANRALLSLNRFGVAGDAGFATTFGKNMIAKSGNEYEVVPGPNDNNPIGITVWGAWQLYKAIGGRELELTLIRLYEGLVFNEQVSGHPGLTCREALPAWTLELDGVNDTIARTRFGNPVLSPVTYSAALEQEILDTFFDGVIFTYRENPEEYYFNFKAINELGQFAATFVFDGLEEDPPFLRISDCCSSWMISQIGDWEGAYWANHNSRDNFTDYVMGYLAAFEAENTVGLPADLAQAAANAAEAARRTGNAIADAGMIQMTVDEHNDYMTLVPGGQVRPDGETEWQDLGSLSSCQMVYVAQAISDAGLTTPVPELPLPGAIETSALVLLFDTLGLPLTPPLMHCTSLDAAFIGLGWGEILNGEIFGIPWYDWAAIVDAIFPDLLNELIGSTADDFKELVLGAVNLCYYAQIQGDDALYRQAHRTLRNLIGMTYHLTDLVYGAKSGGFATTNSEELYYLAAMYARMFDIDSPIADFGDFARGDQSTTWIESQLTLGDTAPAALIDDAQIKNQIDSKLDNIDPWLVPRYDARFGAPPDRTYPVRRAGDGYECLGPDNNWMPTENSRHRWFGSIDLFHEAALCNTDDKHTLDCSWAALGCEVADLNDDGTSDAADQTLFDSAFATYGAGAVCDAGNSWCDGADLDRNGTLGQDDQDFIVTAQGCVR